MDLNTSTSFGNAGTIMTFSVRVENGEVLERKTILNLADKIR
jgi:hypothetical protein